MKLNYVVELHKNLKYVIRKGGLYIRLFIKVVLNLKNGKSKKSVFKGLFLINQNFQ